MSARRLLTISLILIFLTLHFGFVVFVAQADSDDLSNSQKKVPSQYPTVTPIKIGSDADFEALFLPGNGTARNPYIIESLHFFTDRIAINISNTVSYFVIRNCEFDIGTDFLLIAIRLTNVSNGVIEKSTFRGGSISVIESQNCSIRKVKVSSPWYDIFLLDSTRITVEYNKLSNSDHGILIVASTEVLVLANEISHCGYGVALEIRARVTIESNMFVNCGIYPYDISTLKDVVLITNRVNGKPVGFFKNQTGRDIDGNQYGQIILFGSSHLNIQGGFFNMKSTSLLVAYSSFISIHDVRIVGGTETIMVISSSDVIIDRVTASDCGTVIAATNSENVQVLNSNLENLSSGIAMYSTSCAIVNNTITSASIVGIIAVDANNSMFDNNRLVNCSWGIYLSNNRYVTITNNRILQSDKLGLKLLGTFYVEVENNTLAHARYGAILSICYALDFRENTIYNNSEVGIQIARSFSSTIQKNIVFNNTVGISILVDSNRITLYGNHLTMNTEADAIDDGYNNQWDDGVSLGNYWGNYNGTGNYTIPGDAGSVDRFPQISDIDGDGISDVDELERGLDPLTPNLTFDVRGVLLFGLVIVGSFIVYKYISRRSISPSG